MTGTEIAGFVVGGIVLLIAWFWVQVKVAPYTWYIDARDGDDRNPSNSRTFPLQTNEEFLHRLKLEYPVIRHKHTIYAQGSGSHHLRLDVDVKRDGLVFEERGRLVYVTPRGILEVKGEA